MKKFRSVMEKVCGGISYISMFALLVAVAIQVIDVIFGLITDYVPNVGIAFSGSQELVALMMVIMMFLTFGKTQLEDGHVRVDMFVNKFPPKVGCAVNGIMQIICAIFAILMTYKAAQQFMTYQSRGTASDILKIPFAPFAVIEVIGFVIYAIAIIITAIEWFAKMSKAKEEAAEA